MVEKVLVDQIVGDIWRLKRFELAELAYFHEIRKSRLTSTLVSMSGKEFSIAKERVEDQEQVREVRGTRRENKLYEIVEAKFRRRSHESLASLSEKLSGEPIAITPPPKKRTYRPKEEEARDNVDRKLEETDDVGAILLDGMAWDPNSFPFAVERVRSSIVRELTRKYAILAEIQDRRLSVVSDS